MFLRRDQNEIIAAMDVGGSHSGGKRLRDGADGTRSGERVQTLGVVRWQPSGHREPSEREPDAACAFATELSSARQVWVERPSIFQCQDLAGAVRKHLR